MNKYCGDCEIFKNRNKKGVDLIGEINKHNTNEENVDRCLEEMFELIEVLFKQKRDSPKFSKEKLTMEIAHVLMMVSVVADQNEINPMDIFFLQEEAIIRMKKGIK